MPAVNWSAVTDWIYSSWIKGQHIGQVISFSVLSRRFVCWNLAAFDMEAQSPFHAALPAHPSTIRCKS
jgi:hypothetical protein